MGLDSSSKGLEVSPSCLWEQGRVESGNTLVFIFGYVESGNTTTIMTLTKADKKQFFEAGSQNALDKKSRLMIPGWFDARLD